MRKFNGILIDENGTPQRYAKFVCFGEMSVGTKCYHEVNENGEEIEGWFYFMSRRKIDGKNYQLFVLEGVE